MAGTLGQDATLEWFGRLLIASSLLSFLRNRRPFINHWDLGATTFRLKAKGITIFLDTWLERPSNIQTYLKVEDVQECDYIFISHAHFDQYVTCRFGACNKLYIANFMLWSSVSPELIA